MKVLDESGLQYLWSKIQSSLSAIDSKPTIYFGECATAAATANKEITITPSTYTTPKVGDMITVYFTATNTNNTPRFVINGEGLYTIKLNRTVISTSTGRAFAGYASNWCTYYFDGESFVYIGKHVDSTYATYSFCFGHAATTAGTSSAVTASITSYAAPSTSNYGSVISLIFSQDVDANATLKINSRTAYPLYYKNNKVKKYQIKAGDLVTITYFSSKYIILNIQGSEWYSLDTYKTALLPGKYYKDGIVTSTESLGITFVPEGTVSQWEILCKDSDSTPQIIKVTYFNNAYTYRYEPYGDAA